MASQGSRESEHSLDEFLGEPTSDLSAWHWLWERDEPFPIRSHRGPLGAVVVFFKRLLRPWVKTPQNDLWERQRVFNLVVLETLQTLQLLEPVLAEADRLRWNAQEFKDLSVYLSRFVREGVADVVQHNDALYSRVDQKLDRYRRETRELLASLHELIEGGRRSDESVRPTPDPQTLQSIDLEAASGERKIDWDSRIPTYLELLPPSGRVLDLGCGEGELLAALAESGYAARGVDPAADRVEACRRRGLQAARGDLVEDLESEAEGSLAAIFCLRYLERLAPAAVVRLVRAAWKRLEPGGRLILETPNPLSIVVASREFWADPQRTRPIHPEHLGALLEAAGFEDLRRLELGSFSADEQLSEISLDGLGDEARRLADQVNRLRDQLDGLLFGHREYALVGRKPS